MNLLLFGYVLYTIATVLELLLLSVKTTKHIRQPLGVLCLLLTSGAHAVIVANEPLLFGLPFLFVGLYRMINIMRFSYSRMHTDYLYKVTGTSSFVLGIIQALIGVLAFYVAKNDTLLRALGYLLVFGALVVVTTALISLARQLKSSRLNVLTTFASDEELPSVTIAIPARNETHELADCVRSFVQSDYKKLEILVLDDCSHESTSDIIKKFAHDGVRFIQGSEPGDTWLAKNAGYNKLAMEATGEYLLFCGVDVRVNKDTVRQLMTRMTQQGLEMVSILPMRASGAPRVSFAQLVRYIWELCVPRKLLRRPPVLSTAWLIKADTLKNHGGLGAVKRKVIPESFFARALAQNGLYAFWRTNSECVLESNKDAKAQQQTTIRVRYPQLHKKPENVASIAIVELALLGAPFVAYALWQSVPIVLMLYLGVLYTVILAVAVVLASSITSAHKFWYVVQTFAAVPVDVWLTHLSLWRYEFSRIDWKDRNVCLPVMHVVPHLPRLEDSSATEQDQEQK